MTKNETNKGIDLGQNLKTYDGQTLRFSAEKEGVLRDFIAFVLNQTPSADVDTGIKKYKILEKLGGETATFTTDEISLIKECCVPFQTSILLGVMKLVAPNDLK